VVMPSTVQGRGLKGLSEGVRLLVNVCLQVVVVYRGQGRVEEILGFGCDGDEVSVEEYRVQNG
jgi:hypothetical protein